jgi:hypothetical protein
MSKISELGEGYKNLPIILEAYNNAFKDIEANLEIRGKSLEKANMENAALKYYYAHRLSELGTLTKFFEQEVARVRGKLFRGLTEANNRELGERAKEQYINNEAAYLRANELYLEVKEVRDMYEAGVEAFTTRGYSLNNITKIRVAQLEDDLL